MANPDLQDVRKRREQIAKISAELKVEDDELAVAEKVLLRLGAAGQVVPPPLPPIQHPTMFPLPQPPVVAPSPAVAAGEDDGMSLIELVKHLMKGNETLEQLIVLLFENCNDVWWTANEVQSHLTIIKGKDVPMASVSPTLTNMKNSGLLVRNGLHVGLPSKVAQREMETATK